MKQQDLNRRLAYTFIPLFFAALPLIAQDTSNKRDNFSIEKGTILTGFSIDGIRASRDSYNHEFERAISRMQFNVEGLYFLSDRMGIGPIVGYEYLFREFESEFSVTGDQWSWNLLYGAKAGYYISAKELFSSGTLEHIYLFVNGGISWLWNKRRTEGQGSLEPNNRFGYHLGTGLLIPMGRRISLEWKLGWDGRRQDYTFDIIENGQPIGRGNETKWLKELSLGLGLKVAL